MQMIDDNKTSNSMWLIYLLVILNYYQKVLMFYKHARRYIRLRVRLIRWPTSIGRGYQIN